MCVCVSNIPGVVDRSVVSIGLVGQEVGVIGRVSIGLLLRILLPRLVRVIGIVLVLKAFIPVLRGRLWPPFLLAERQAHHAKQNDQQQRLPRPHLLVSLKHRVLGSNRWTFPKCLIPTCRRLNHHFPSLMIDRRLIVDSASQPLSCPFTFAPTPGI